MAFFKTTKSTMQTRTSEFAEKLCEAEIEVAFLVKPHNVFYFSEYDSVCSGVLVRPDNKPIFITIWLDAPEARTICTIPTVVGYVFPRERLVAKMIKLAGLKKPNIRRIGVEMDFILARDHAFIMKAFPDAEIVDVTPIVDRMRSVKSSDEISKMKISASIADSAMEAALNAVKPGVTEFEIAAEAEYVMRKLGSERPAFGTFVASGKRTLLAHPHASRRTIQPNDPVVIDLGATWEGYASDLCRTTFAGKPSENQKAFLRVVLQAQEAAASVLRDGSVAGDVFNAAHDIFLKHDLGRFLPDDIGYGVGLRQSEFLPIIERNSTAILRENMVVALLQTTAFKKDLGGLRVEDAFRVTQDGSERLTHLRQPTFD
jgi:Xaa-Pro aminopeptidase